MAFTDEELDYLRSQPLARLATVAPDGQPDVTPIALEVEGTTLWVCGAGDAVLRTRKIRNITAGHRQVALVVDDLPYCRSVRRARHPHLRTGRRPRRPGRHGRPRALRPGYADDLLELEPRGCTRRRHLVRRLPHSPHAQFSRGRCGVTGLGMP